MSNSTPELCTIAALAGSRPTHLVKAGEIIFRSGDHGDVLYGVVAGTIALTWGSALKETVGPGGCFGVGALVDPDHRREGLATALLTELVHRTGGEHARLTLEVRESNQNAIDLYERFGFLAAGLRRRYYQDNGEDALIMWRTPHTLEGRLDDVIISAGYRIGPFEVESALVAHAAVAEAAVVAAPDEERGSVVRAVVVLRDGYAPSEALAAELQDHVKGQTAPYKYPRVVDFADELPKTASGKVKRAALRTG